MNDEFLIQFREAPRVEFADALYKRISQQSQPGFAFTIWNKLTLRNAGALLVLIVVVAACAYYAATQTPYHKVGEIWLTVQKTYVPEFIPVSKTPEENPVESQAYDCPLFSVEEAREILRFDFLVPTWAPEGFTFTDAVCGVDAISDFVSLTWTGNDGNSYIGITSQNLRWYDRAAKLYRIGPAAVWEPIAPGSYEEVQVNGQPAVLVRGDWASPPVITEPLPNRETEVGWNRDLGLRLYWVHGEALYHLYTMADVSVEDLIKMAESAR